MQKVQKGFTLIELVVVSVLLGILGVTALAKFQDLSTDAQTAANAGVAAEMSSGASINYAARSLSASNGTSLLNTSCDAIASAVMTVKPSDYTFAGTGCAASSGVAVSCTVDKSPGAQATTSVICG
jgi:prepilin-type N-terminal cleavage/methylation domain-containing protein